MVGVAEKRYADTTANETSPSVVLLSNRSHGGKSGHETFVESPSTARQMKSSRGGIEVDIELNSYSDRAYRDEDK
jgi:hypothetical protein